MGMMTPSLFDQTQRRIKAPQKTAWMGRDLFGVGESVALGETLPGRIRERIGHPSVSAIRVVLDGRLRTPPDATLFDDIMVPVWLLCAAGTQHAFTDLLQDRGAEIVPVPVDDEGLSLAAARATAADARMAIVTPSHHYPLGVVMSRRCRLASAGSGAVSGHDGGRLVGELPPRRALPLVTDAALERLPGELPIGLREIAAEERDHPEAPVGLDCLLGPELADTERWPRRPRCV